MADADIEHLREIFLAPKAIEYPAEWWISVVSRDKTRLICNLPLQINKTLVEGLFLRLTAEEQSPDREVMVQLEYQPAGMPYLHLQRFDWRCRHSHGNNQASMDLPRVIVKSGVWAFSSSGDLIILHDFDTVFKFNSSNNFPEAVEAA